MRLFSAAITAVALAGQCTADKLKPPVLPLAVRNPYFNAWLQNARDVPWSKWPMFWTGEEVGAFHCINAERKTEADNCRLDCPY